MAVPTVGAVPTPVFNGGLVATTAGVTTQVANSSFISFIPNFGTTLVATDSKLNVYSLLGVGTTVSGINYAAYKTINGVGGAGHTFTGTATVTGNIEIFPIEIIGADTITLIDVFSSPQWTGLVAGPNYTSNALTTGNPDELILAITSTFSNTGTETRVWGNGYVEVSGENNASNFTGGIAILGAPTSGTTTNSTFTSSGAGTTGAVTMLVSIKSAGGGGGAVNQPYMNYGFQPRMAQ